MAHKYPKPKDMMEPEMELQLIDEACSYHDNGTCIGHDPNRIRGESLVLEDEEQYHLVSVCGSCRCPDPPIQL